MVEGEKNKRSPTTELRDSRAERLTMLEFLRVPENFAIMTGQATKGKTVRGGQKITRGQGYAMLAKFVNNASKDHERVWNTQDARSRYQTSTCDE